VVVAGLCFFFFRKTKASASTALLAEPWSKVAAKAPRKIGGKAGVHSCNVLEISADSQRLWQFDARSGRFVLNREQISVKGQTTPARLVSKDWRALWQPRLNIAWLSPEHVFLRVAQLPLSDPNETLAMVELQLEKLSPMPVAQIVWSMHVLPQTKDDLQTVIVMIVARNIVEEFLGKLEGQGFLADRLESPLIDQLQAARVSEDGAWIYPEASVPGAALVAWWYGGVLQNLALVKLPSANRPESLKEQLLQMSWAGELEGWLTSRPRWHLVANEVVAAEWEPVIRQGLDEPVEVLPPLLASELAGLMARRAAQADPKAGMLPVEFAARYQQQFVDRLWMRALLALGGLYAVGLVIYFIALQVALFRTQGVEKHVAEIAPAYTNAIQLKARLNVLTDRQELKYAALDCWKAIAEHMPEGAVLESSNLGDGRRLTLVGTAPGDQVQALYTFEGDLRKHLKDGQPLFSREGGEHLNIRQGSGGTVNWNFSLELKRVEIQ
jgi:hypothetical protein